MLWASLKVSRAVRVMCKCANAIIDLCSYGGLGKRCAKGVRWIWLVWYLLATLGVHSTIPSGPSTQLSQQQSI